MASPNLAKHRKTVICEAQHLRREIDTSEAKSFSDPAFAPIDSLFAPDASMKRSAVDEASKNIVQNIRTPYSLGFLFGYFNNSVLMSIEDEELDDADLDDLRQHFFNTLMPDGSQLLARAKNEKDGHRRVDNFYEGQTLGGYAAGEMRSVGRSNVRDMFFLFLTAGAKFLPSLH